ncbi:uncharacterized protein LOC142803563 [Rhipicephalus microplus]|uniref:uncharacterized protein LOC142803563 n=1 Tax=Rhipicephalus microplus TaxID=6941 RepID=UPI003F6CEDF3
MVRSRHVEPNQTLGGQPALVASAEAQRRGVHQHRGCTHKCGCLPHEGPSAHKKRKSDTHLQLISGMVAGSSSDNTEVEAPEFAQALSAPQQPSNIEDFVTGRRNSPSDSGDGARRKRRKYTGAEMKEKMLNEQRLLREQFEAAHKEEMEIRTKASKLQEKLVDAMVHFLNKK